MISVRIQGKPFNITVVQVYAPTTGAEEAEVDQFYEGLQHLLELTPKNDVLNIMGDWNAKVTNRFKELDLIDRVPEELWTEVRNIVQEVATKTIPKKKKCKKAKWLSEEALQIAEERREAKGKGERESYTQLNAEFQKIARRDKNAFFNEQCKEIEENNRIWRARDLFKEIGDMKGKFHAKMDDTTVMTESEEELKSLLMQVKEESAKVSLKLNIKKTKIMASGPITSWQIEVEEMEVVTGFIFLASMITADGDCSQEIKRRLLLGRKAMANLDSIIKAETSPWQQKCGKIANIDNTCCKKCIEPECKQVTGRLEYVKVDDCVNENQLNIHYCEGKCESKAVYNITTNQIEDECTCCSATIIDSMKVPLRCVNGSIVHQEVLNARQCDCFSRKCKPQI
ncbi:von Willebrand factor [Varanus komodoensis]|nr:von Willebrand factor [Varanus komodoensis]